MFSNRRRSFPFPTLLAFIVFGIIILSLVVYGYAKITGEDEVEVTKEEEVEEKKEEIEEIEEEEHQQEDEPEKLHDNSDPNNILVLVNKEESLSEDYRPDDLVVPNVKFSFQEDVDKRYLREPAATALESLFQAAKTNNIELYAVSGFRSYERQKEIYNNKVESSGEEEAKKLVALPGHSEHQTGLTMDVSIKSMGFVLEESFGETDEGIWLRENAHKYGFIIRYDKGKENITGYEYEPWHIRYVGQEAAQEIFEQDITLEEYLGYFDPAILDGNKDSEKTNTKETTDDPLSEDDSSEGKDGD